ncbi:MAG: hypothetical protein PeribacterA2_0607 [Candidatus Peribacter riflensis]|uniref:Uncharacterized protein n=1 Tax=Candidatus Peribacter riflensis TaxID=1735162 RepID=A0A0S1SKX5_9BACT|nr:MAG: hypothetical protein PeribacterA2_0607 [Candidatus Peribacter riflensis]ALM11082.1 MAG: hypothetical protein PeribacterB2_0607 [Candidatus Peribacter riflensis]ALM12185.1 MAG: hypothetical protein PeribacterC2_0607 [Candidatus Peribacter riflensis]ALM13288.1 MAG: hypothetical protein PeribacterD1_0608 [Candidatus Peribacter riflensis]ALM14388.1 MAG: hypothetical protein PeribacterD2_0607 [Candidatus Peribacter riflensis]
MRALPQTAAYFLHDIVPAHTADTGTRYLPGVNIRIDSADKIGDLLLLRRERNHTDVLALPVISANPLISQGNIHHTSHGPRYDGVSR